MLSSSPRPLIGLSEGPAAGNDIYPAHVGAPVKLSAFSVVDEYDGAEGSHRLLDVLSLAEAAETGGLSALWVAEHHFHAGGVCPSPPILLAAASGKTRRLRLGALVSVLPFHSPIELAEQYAMVDRLSGGRLNLGVGSGYIPMEFAGFGVDPATKRARFDAGLDTLLAAFRGEEVRAEGREAAAVHLNIRPVQTPHPPIWVAVQRREAIPFVAARGMSIALIPYATLSGLPELAEEVQEFRSHRPAGSRGEVAAGFHLYAGDHPDRARAALQRYLDSRRATQSAFYLEKVARDASHASAKTIEESGFALIGSPREVARRLEAVAETGVDEVLGLFDFGGLPTDEVARSVIALGRALSASL